MFSYGVVVLEFISGCFNFDFYVVLYVMYLFDWVCDVFKLMSFLNVNIFKLIVFEFSFVGM